MTDILSLPPEILSRILDYIALRDLSSVCLSCKKLRDVVYVNSVWQRKCKQEYNFRSIEGWNVNYRTLYSKVLRLYGDLVGFWRREFQCYGGLLQIKYDKGCIKGLEVLAPACSRVDGPLRKKAMFKISMTPSETVQIVSVHNFPLEEEEEGGDGEGKMEDKGGGGEGKMEDKGGGGEEEGGGGEGGIEGEEVQRPCLLRVEQDEMEGRILEYKVTDTNFILQKEGIRTRNYSLDLRMSSVIYVFLVYQGLISHPVFRRWLSEELGSDPYADMYLNCLLRKGVAYMSLRHEYRWSPLELPSKNRVNVPIQPGLFKGTYSAHGIEILSLDYNDEQTEVTVTKITGDPNVPASEVSVYGDLTSPLVLTVQQQESLDTLTAVPEHHVAKQSGLAARQPFRIPEHFSDRDNQIIPEFCTFRCRAKGQIAGHSFMTPCFSDGHFVVFDERKFGMVWLELMSFSVFFRVDEKDLNE